MPRLPALLLSAALAGPVAAVALLPQAVRAEAPARLITVTGEGSVQAAPDQATISLGVTTQGDTAASAMASNNAALSQVMDRLRAAGIAEADMQTSNLSMNPNWTNGEDGAPRISGYVATNMLTLRVRMLDTLGAVLDAAVSSNANTLNGLTFGMADARPLQDQARKAAVADAIARATLLAEAAGTKLGRVVSISEQGTWPGPAPMFRMDAAAASPVPVAGGEVGITASVSVVFEIAD